MNPTNDEQDLFGLERLPNEQARAFQHFCIYRDLGPLRSIDKAWKRDCADRGKDCKSERRPGYWAAMSVLFDWVARAEACDERCEEEKRAEAAQRRELLKESRDKFAMEQQQQMQDQVLKMNVLFNKSLTQPFVVGTTEKRDKVTGIKSTLKVFPSNFSGILALARALKETFHLAMEGVGTKEPEETEREIDHVFWLKKEPEPAQNVLPESDEQQLQAIAEVNAQLAAEEDPEPEPAQEVRPESGQQQLQTVAEPEARLPSDENLEPEPVQKALPQPDQQRPQAIAELEAQPAPEENPEPEPAQKAPPEFGRQQLQTTAHSQVQIASEENPEG
jgi:hypothetical protein